jgi:hypothetical protein
MWAPRIQYGQYTYYPVLVYGRRPWTAVAMVVAHALASFRPAESSNSTPGTHYDV